MLIITKNIQRLPKATKIYRTCKVNVGLVCLFVYVASKETNRPSMLSEVKSFMMDMLLSFNIHRITASCKSLRKNRTTTVGGVKVD